MRQIVARLALTGLAAAFLAFVSGAQAHEQVGPVDGAGADIAMTIDGPSLSVMTYNVEGLPFPFARGRDAAAAQIAARLRSLRGEGRQPHVVVLQEAFGAAQRAIGIEAGYRFAAYGPDEKMRSDEAMTAPDRAFAARASLFKGEKWGKWRGSGLIVLSDYPIVRVVKAAFPAWACAGFDCLANKGVMIAEIAVPGVEKPVAVVATHLNSKGSSGVGKARWSAAFDRQVTTIRHFLAANLRGDSPYVFAGDTNVGHSPSRRDLLAGALPGRGDQPVRMALSTCLDARNGCTIDAPSQAARSFENGKDWQVYVDGTTARLQPLRISIPFGADARGRMLSDHIGYSTLYRIAAAPRS